VFSPPKCCAHPFEQCHLFPPFISGRRTCACVTARSFPPSQASDRRVLPLQSFAFVLLFHSIPGRGQPLVSTLFEPLRRWYGNLATRSPLAVSAPPLFFHFALSGPAHFIGLLGTLRPLSLSLSLCLTRACSAQFGESPAARRLRCVGFGVGGASSAVLFCPHPHFLVHPL